MIFKKNFTSKHKCIRYVDSDYAEDLNKRRSTTGYVFILSQAPVSWRSTLQFIVTLSTMEAEFVTMTEAMKEAIWLQGLLDDLRIDHDLLKVNNCDSMSAIYLAKNHVYHVVPCPTESSMHISCQCSVIVSLWVCLHIT